MENGLLQRCERVMLKEMNNFLKIYCEETKNEKVNINFSYPSLIKTLGNYILTSFTKETWLSTSICIVDINKDTFTVDFSVFTNSKYKENVEKYLLALEKLFYYDGSEFIYKYIETIQDEEEKSLCRDYYKHLLDHCSFIKHLIFSDKGLQSQDAEQSKKNFLEYINSVISHDEQKTAIIINFVEKIKLISSEYNENELKNIEKYMNFLE